MQKERSSVLHVRDCARVHVRGCIPLYVDICISMYKCVYMYMRVRERGTCLRACACLRARPHVRVCIHICTWRTVCIHICTWRTVRVFTYARGATACVCVWVFENDDIIVAHNITDFPNGTTDAVMMVHLKKDGLIWRTETGSTPIPK